MVWILTFVAAATAGLRGELSATGAYHVADAASGNVLMRGADVAVYMDGAWHVGGVNLTAVGASNVSGVDRVFGPYTGTRVEWRTASSVAVVFATSLLNFADAIVFETAYPEGAARTAHANAAASGKHGVIANFPAMRTLAPKLGGALSWAGEFIAASRKRTYGLSGGPTVFYDDPRAGVKGSTVLIGAPLDHFKCTGETDRLWDGSAGAWVPGTAATVQSLPRGFTHRFTLQMGAPGGGVTSALHAWGEQLRTRFNTTRVADPTLSALSYTTDNGAQLCFCTEDCDAKLIAVRDALVARGAPTLGAVSWQGGWWKNPKIHTPLCAPWCVSSWEANATKNPMGVAALDAALGGIPLQLYAPYFCADTAYDKRNGGKYDFVDADTTIDGCGGYTFRTPSPDDAAVRRASESRRPGRAGALLRRRCE
jgi:hypothetical protein